MKERFALVVLIVLLLASSVLAGQDREDFLCVSSGPEKLGGSTEIWHPSASGTWEEELTTLGYREESTYAATFLDGKLWLTLEIPDLVSGTSVSFNGYAWAGMNFVGDSMVLSGNFFNAHSSTESAILSWFTPDGALLSTGQLSSVSGKSMSMFVPTIRTTLDSVTTDAYRWNVTITSIPEPSSMLALVGGMTSLGGFILRRRRA